MSLDDQIMIRNMDRFLVSLNQMQPAGRAADFIWREAIRQALAELGFDEGLFVGCPYCGDGAIWPEAFDDRHDGVWVAHIHRAMRLAVLAGAWPDDHRDCLIDHPAFLSERIFADSDAPGEE